MKNNIYSGNHKHWAFLRARSNEKGNGEREREQLTGKTLKGRARVSEIRSSMTTEEREKNEVK